MPSTAQAGENDWWQRTDQREHARIEHGADAYRKGDYAAAEQAFTGIDSADAWYNQANALAKQGKYDEAIAAYDQALKLQPKMEDAIENRKVVDAARKRKPPSGQNQNRNQDQGQGKQKSQQQKNGQAGDGKTEPKQPPSDAQGNAQNSQQTPPKTGAGQTPEQPRTPQQQAADAKAQQAADAAQRQRMQQAMAQAGKQSAQAGKNDPQAAARATETPEQRERRQAVEAWLRRVPDEPGGLLKTKFQLEYERRQKEGQ